MVTNNTKDGYTIFSNELYTLGLSVDAIAVYAYMASKLGDWTYRPGEIRKALDIGDFKWRSATNELRQHGLYELTKTTKGTVVTLHRLEITGTRGKPTSGKPHGAETHPWENHALNSNNSNNNKRDSNTNKNLIVATKVATYLAEKILRENPTAKLKPDNWVKDIDRAIRIDERTEKDLIGLINYFYASDPFWVKNIQSGKKLREKFDQITMSRLQDKKHKRSSDKNGGFSALEIKDAARPGEQLEQVIAKLQRAR
jgi:hypothetical protein